MRWQERHRLHSPIRHPGIGHRSERSSFPAFFLQRDLDRLRGVAIYDVLEAQAESSLDRIHGQAAGQQFRWLPI